MKKIIQLVLSFIVAFILLGCSSEVTVQYESANFTKITYTYDKKTDVITKFKIENRTEVPDEEEAEKIKEFFKRLGTLEGIKTSASEKYLIVDTSLEIDLKVLKYSDMKKSFVPAIRNLAEYFLDGDKDNATYEKTSKLIITRKFVQTKK